MKFIKWIKEYISKEKELIKHLLLILVTWFLITPVLPFLVMLIYFELWKVRRQNIEMEQEIKQIKEEIKDIKYNL